MIVYNKEYHLYQAKKTYYSTEIQNKYIKSTIKFQII